MNHEISSDLSELSKALNDLFDSLHNDLVTQNLVGQLLNNILQSNVVDPKYKKIIKIFYKKFKTISQKLGPLSQLTRIRTIQNLHGEKMLVALAIYYLCDLTKYDYHLINYCFKIGLDTENIIVLLLLNNINDINYFCQKYRLDNYKSQHIATLKKLSAYHKLLFNF